MKLVGHAPELPFFLAFGFQILVIRPTTSDEFHVWPVEVGKMTP